MDALTIRPGFGESLAVLTEDGRAVARYNWSPAKNHPYFSDVTPTTHAGILSNHAPYDHRWHHGIWWAWKFINDVNFWEDHADFGGTRKGLGRALVVAHEISEDHRQGSASIHESIEWIPDGSARSLISESRVVTLSADGDAWFMDWSLTFTANQDLTFAAAPYPEVSWGGYAGLNYRPARSMRDGEELIANNGRSGLAQVHGQATSWAAYGGLVDGAGTDNPDEPARGSVAIVPHQDNAWESKCYAASADNGFGFLAAAPLFGADRSLSSGEALNLRFKVCVSDGAPASTALDHIAAEYADPRNTNGA